MAIVGIDLGTTTSEVAVYQNDRPHVLQDLRGREIVDSYFGIDNKTRDPLVGERVRSIFMSYPELCVEQVKRRMGEEVLLRVGDQTLRPEEVSANILRHLKNSAEAVLGEDVDRAVITVPASFPNAAREATIQAGQIAGFKVERIISEPTAAALAYGHQQNSEEDMVMVYDLGGGTFDVSIVEFIGPTLDVRASDGDMQLGGKDFDRLILNHVVERTGLQIAEDSGEYYKLLFACEDLKRELSFNPVATLHVPFFTVRNGQPVNIDLEVSRATFERMIAPLIDKTRGHIERVLREAKLDKSQITRVLLVGGSTRMPYVRRLVEEVMSRKAEQSIDPDRAVALGAAVQAAIIDGQSDQIIMDVLPLSLGTATVQMYGEMGVPGMYSEILPRNWKHLKSRSSDFYTMYDNQAHVDFRVYQQNSKTANEFAEIEDEPNTDAGYTLVGKRLLEIPPGPAGQLVRATYTYNLDGVVDVTIEAGGKHINFQVSMKLDEEAISRAKARLDDSWQKSRLYSRLRSLFNAAERELDKGMAAEEEKRLRDLLDQLKSAMSANDEAAAKRLEEQVTDLLFDMS
ncbi:Hsp70 family protein [bacterium]|nr:Hsp70 family protein [bacterium]